MKVAYFVAEYQRVAGSQRSLLNLIRNLPPQMETVVIFPEHGKCKDLYDRHGIRTEVIQAPGELNVFDKKLLHHNLLQKCFNFLFRVLPYSFRVNSYLKKNNYQVLHCNTGRAVLLASFIPKLMGTKIIKHIRGRSIERKYFSLEMLSNMLANRIILVAHSLRDDLAPFLIKKACVIYNSIDVTDLDCQIEEQTDDSYKNMYGKDKIIFLMLASVVPFKGYHHLLEATMLARQQCNNFLVIAAGETADENYYNHISRKMYEYSVQGVFHFLGWIDNLLEVYKRADVIVMPSVEEEKVTINNETFHVSGNEGFPRVILEAMYLAKPVIATDIAGVPEQVIHNETGLIVPPANPKALAEAMIELVNDKEKRARMGRQAYERYAAHFSPDKTGKEVINVYNELLS